MYKRLMNELEIIILFRDHLSVRCWTSFISMLYREASLLYYTDILDALLDMFHARDVIYVS